MQISGGADGNSQLELVNILIFLNARKEEDLGTHNTGLKLQWSGMNVTIECFVHL